MSCSGVAGVPFWPFWLVVPWLSSVAFHFPHLLSEKVKTSEFRIFVLISSSVELTQYYLCVTQPHDATLFSPLD